MRFTRSKVSIAFSFVALAAIVTAFAVSGALKGATPTKAASPASSTHYSLNCASNNGQNFCTEVSDPSVFGYYVGHDEPSTLFYSNVPGSGNQMRYTLWLPKDPSSTVVPGRSYNFELHPAFWFGMALCDTQSYPEVDQNCTPDSDSNISDPSHTYRHHGTAFMEMQFYPPGWVEWPAGNSCDPTKWCAALNIDSFQENPVTGQFNNSACQSLVGIEPVNFAFITKSGKSQAPANPVQSTLATYTPNPSKDLFMNSGDEITITMHDTANGLQIVLNDQTTGQSGSMTASAANGFGQVQWDPTGSTCNNIPYNFHPMYSTSSEMTRVTWAAHSYNIAFSDEIGHFQACSKVDPSTGTCVGKEGTQGDLEPADGDDVGCFPASDSSLVQVSGCLGTNIGFDGSSYQNLWPDGNYNMHPTPVRYTSPLTGSNYNVEYSRMAFEADLPRIEDNGFSPYNNCDRNTGAGCTLIPITDDGDAAVFYPFFSDTMTSAGCVWQIGNHIPGSMSDFHQNQQYGTLLNLTYTGTGGHPVTKYDDFRQVLSYNPCPAQKE